MDKENRRDHGKTFTLQLSDDEHGFLMDFISKHAGWHLAATDAGDGAAKDEAMKLYQRLEMMDANDCFTQTREGRINELKDGVDHWAAVVDRARADRQTEETIRFFRHQLDSLTRELDALQSKEDA